MRFCVLTVFRYVKEASRRSLSRNCTACVD